MNTYQLILTLVGAIVSVVFAMVLIWYSKHSIVRTMSRRHVLHMLKTRCMNGKELTYAARECNSEVVSYKLIPVLLVRLEEEGLIQKTSNNAYTITTKGTETLNEIESISKEFQKIYGMVNKASMIGKYIMNETINRMAMMTDREEEKRIAQ